MPARATSTMPAGARAQRDRSSPEIGMCDPRGRSQILAQPAAYHFVPKGGMGRREVTERHSNHSVGTGDPAGPPRVAVRFAARGLFVLTVINLLNYLDRFIPSAVLPQMKASGIVSTDFQLGFLAPGFVVVYMLAAPAFGYLGDRRSRTRPIAIGVALWSLATMWSGLSRTYWELFASRAAVGIGEAAYATISPALLADYYPPARRGRIFAIFYMAIPVGAALGYVVGGLVSQAWGWRA